MRAILLTAFWVTLAACVTAATPGEAATNCFDRAKRDVGVRDSISVFTNDSTVIRGTHATFMVSSSLLYMKSTTNPVAVAGVSIPFENINRITYTKPAPGRWVPAFVGLGIGAAVGGIAGAALAPEPRGFLDMPDVCFGVLSAVIGGAIGAACGSELGKHKTMTVTLKCR